AARRRVYHRRAFEALERAGAPAAELSHQALAAGLKRRVFHWSLAAGDEALQLFAAREAVAHYRQAEQAVTSAVAFEQRTQLYLQAGRANELLNDWAAARSAYESFLAAARAAREPAAQCLALNRLATLAAWSALDVPLAESLLAEAGALA